MTSPRVFISMGTPYNQRYLDFRSALERYLRDTCGVDPRILGVNEYPPGNPLAKIRDVMRKCHGVVIVAYERKYVADGAEKRDSPAMLQIQQQSFTTPWNHIESAIAYSLDLPIYVLCENGLTEDGLIETRVDWYVQHSDFVPDRLRDPQIDQSIRAWIDERVRPRASKPRLFNAVEGKLRFSDMTPKEVWGAGAFVSAVFAAGVAAGHWLPGVFR